MDEHRYIDISSLATGRQREAAAILDTLPDQTQRVRLVELLADEALQVAEHVAHTGRLRVKLTHQTADGSDVELSNHNHGLVIDTVKDMRLGAPMTLRDVATGKAVARLHRRFWYYERGAPGDDPLDHIWNHQKLMRLFIQGA